MTSSTRISSALLRPSTSFGLAAAGGAAVMGLIPLTALVSEWWLMGATFLALMATAGLVVLGFFGLLARTGEPADGDRVAVNGLVADGGRPARERGRRVGLLGSA